VGVTPYFIITGLMLAAIVLQGYQRYRRMKAGTLKPPDLSYLPPPAIGWLIILASLAFVVISQWARHHPSGTP